MNCSKVQRRLLSQLDPERAPPNLRAHLEECAACREYQTRLIQVERHVPMLPAPPAPLALERLLHDIHSKPTWGQSARTATSSRHLDRWRLAAGLAAAVLLIVLVWKMIPGPTDSPIVNHFNTSPYPLLARMQQHTLALADTVKPEEQVKALADVADDLQSEAHKLGREPGNRESLRDLTDWFVKVVNVEVERAGAIPVDQRRAILEPIVQKLAKTAADADQLAGETRETPGNVSLRSLAAAARDAKVRLESLTQPGSARFEPPPSESVAGVPRQPGRLARLSFFPALHDAIGALRADEPLPPGASEELQRFIRNQRLLGALVNASLLMAKETDQFKRAEWCTAVARTFAGEIEKAAVNRDGARTAELSEHLQGLLQRGVAANLNTVVSNTPVGSARDAEFIKLHGEVDKVVGPLEEQLEKSTDPQIQEYLQRTLRALRDGRSDVDKALQGRGKAEIRRIN